MPKSFLVSVQYIKSYFLLPAVTLIPLILLLLVNRIAWLHRDISVDLTLFPYTSGLSKRFTKRYKLGEKKMFYGQIFGLTIVIILNANEQFTNHLIAKTYFSFLHIENKYILIFFSKITINVSNFHSVHS